MTADRWTRLTDLFPDALDLAPDQRDAFLTQACVDVTGAPDPALRQEIESLLAAAEVADLTGTLRSPVAPAETPLPDQVGPWRVTGLLGEGGAGIVYRAERADGRIDRSVALKVLRRAGPAVTRQFDRERQALAMLEHPHIARLYDADVVRDGPLAGTPFLVMECIDGQSITEAADRLRLDVEARLRLVLQACAAVGYAHSRLVLHRDLKPSNVLVTETATGPRAVVLDFGVARLLDADDSLTMTRGGAYTPAYAAPEQVKGGHVTTATDVYGLGALLYETLSGQRPQGRPDVPCAPPSTVAPAHLGRRLVGDLDTICLKALAPEPERRYASADALAADLTRFLDGLPVEARPATARYRLGRFVRRHRTGVAASLVVALAVVGGLGAALWQRAEARHERDRAQIAQAEAESQAERAEAVAGFLEQILRAPNTRWYNEGQATGPDVPIRAVLDEAAARVDRDFADQPDLLADLHHILGDTYGSLGLREEGVRHHRRTLALRESIYTAPHPKIAEALYYSAAGDLERWAESVVVMQRALDMLRVRNEGNNFPFIAHDLAGRYLSLGLPERALAAAIEGAADAETRFVPGTEAFRYRDPILSMLRRNQAAALIDLGRLGDAEHALGQSDSLLARLPRSASLHSSWRVQTCYRGRLRRLQNRLAEAEPPLLACVGDPSPLAMPSPFPVQNRDTYVTQDAVRIGSVELVALYDALGRRTEADRFRARADREVAYTDSLHRVGRALRSGAR